MARGHVLTNRRMSAVGRRAHVGSDAHAADKHFDRARSDPRPHLLAQQMMWYRVIVLLDFDVIVDTHPTLLPLREDVGFGRQRFECGPLDAIEQCATSRAQMPRRTIIHTR